MLWRNIKEGIYILGDTIIYVIVAVLPVVIDKFSAFAIKVSTEL